MGVRGGKTVALTPGQTFYEGPSDVHTIGHNASLTERAKSLVILLKNRDKPAAGIGRTAGRDRPRSVMARAHTGRRTWLHRLRLLRIW